MAHTLGQPAKIVFRSVPIGLLTAIEDGRRFAQPAKQCKVSTKIENPTRQNLATVRAMDRRLRALFAISCAALTAAGLVWLYRDDPAEGHGFPVCEFHALTGLHCPGCGTLRALHQLLHGDVAAALRLNAFSICALPILLMVIVRNSIASWNGRVAYWPRPRWVPAGWRWGIVFLVIAFGVLRNVPYWPFNLLAPH